MIGSLLEHNKVEEEEEQKVLDFLFYERKSSIGHVCKNVRNAVGS